MYCQENVQYRKSSGLLAVPHVYFTLRRCCKQHTNVLALEAGSCINRSHLITQMEAVIQSIHPGNST